MTMTMNLTLTLIYTMIMTMTYTMTLCQPGVPRSGGAGWRRRGGAEGAGGEGGGAGGHSILRHPQLDPSVPGPRAFRVRRRGGVLVRFLGVG